MEPHHHPVLRCTESIERALKDTAGVPVEFMTTPQKREAMLRVTAVAGQLESLRLRLMASGTDVAADEGTRDVATWLAAATRTDRASNARAERLAAALDRRWVVVARALAEARVNLAQAEVIVHGLEQLPADVPTTILDLAEARLVAEADTFGPRELRVIARRILDIVAPELGEDAERRQLEAEERAAHRTTSLVTRRRGDGSTEIRINVPDHAADRLLTYLHAFASPRREGVGEEVSRPVGERLPYPRRLGHAFCALLEAIDPARLPLHGGDATTVIITMDLETLRDGLGTAAFGSDSQITASEARRLACTASLIPAVLGGKSQILDLGRSARLFSAGQRKAMALRDRTCRAQGCEIPAPWCEAHHFDQPWSRGGRTDLADGRLLCHFHHQRAHDDSYLHTELPDGSVRFHRRR